MKLVQIFKYIYGVWLYALIFLFNEVDMKKKGRKGRGGKNKTMTGFFKTISIVYGIVFIPMLGYIVYYLIKDPATPDVMRGIWRKIKGWWSANLLDQKKKTRKLRKKRRRKVDRKVDRELDTIRYGEIPSEYNKND